MERQVETHKEVTCRERKQEQAEEAQYDDEPILGERTEPLSTT